MDIKNRKNNKWYLPDSGIWNERYMDEKANILNLKRNLKELKIIKRYLPSRRVSILDVPCGYGRISNPLAEEGYSVTGVDINKFFIDIANDEAKKKKIEINYIVSDFLKFKITRRFDVVLNIFTSIGYLETEEKNQRFIKKLCNSVNKNGILIIETINPREILENYSTKEEFKTKDGNKIVSERLFDYETSVNHIFINEYYKDGRVYKGTKSIRLYFPHELINICQKYGLSKIDFLNEDGMRKDIENSKRMWLIFKKGKNEEQS